MSKMVSVAETNQFFITSMQRLEHVGYGNGTMLDIGCGLGANAIYAAKHGWDVTALDTTDKPRQVNSSFRYIKGELPFLDIKDGTYDLVVCTGVLPLLDVAVRRKSIKEIMRVTAVGGVAIVDCIVRDDDRNRGGIWRPSSLIQPFVQAGWEVGTSHEPIRQDILRSQQQVVAFRP